MPRTLGFCKAPQRGFGCPEWHFDVSLFATERVSRGLYVTKPEGPTIGELCGAKYNAEVPFVFDNATIPKSGSEEEEEELGCLNPCGHVE